MSFVGRVFTAQRTVRLLCGHTTAGTLCSQRKALHRKKPMVRGRGLKASAIVCYADGWSVLELHLAAT